jgi:beta-glucosidase
LNVSVEVQNRGQRTGDEVVQLYIRDVVASVTRPVKELKGFQRITLRAGETRRIEFTLTPELLGFYNREMQFVVEPGEFHVMVGTSSADEHELQTTFEVVRP